MSDDQIHSTGRGGAGNIGPGEGVYVDSGIVHEGVVGQPGHPGGGEYSAGRGGAGNIVSSPKVGATSGGPPVDASDSIPEPAMREKNSKYDNFHTGRGGEGNVYRDKYGGHSKPPKEEKEGFMEKAKHAVGMDKPKEEKSK
ncbi:hypothetical protein LTR37_003476 [Vermiconidia calcicola]|uniref:Uncharacterized protein n=1 Tax=Vermiconidia calcicola TaxID=1690605 RepID=A0ACC3NQ46_9PEZI|nr:hypothetical protein LTR37_003476 [Vermiconidia calcicola]